MEQLAIVILAITVAATLAAAGAAFKLRQNNKQRRVHHQGHKPA